MNKHKGGFTLIELLAVIIILGILMLIAVPSITNYIGDSRKSAYVNTAKNIIHDTMSYISSKRLSLNDLDTTYYIPTTCINTDNSTKSPYGEFVQDTSYVAVSFDGNDYNYYWISLDETGHGVSKPINEYDLTEDSIESDLVREDFEKFSLVDGTSQALVFNSDCTDASISESVCENKVFLDPNGGQLNKSYKCYNEGDKYGKLPIPTRSGYVFDGWETTSKKVVNENDVFEENNYLYENNYDIDFNGSNYIDTGVYLFNQENANKNFYVSFEIKENRSSDSQATLMNSKNEANSSYPGFLFRRYIGSGYNGYEISIAAASNNSKKVTNIPLNTTKMEFLRINKKIYYRADNGNFSELLNFSNFSLHFEVPVTFGASLNAAGNPYRFFKGILSNIRIAFLDDEATTSNYLEHLAKNDQLLRARWKKSDLKIYFDANGGEVDVAFKDVVEGGSYGDLPIPTREGYIFDGWETNILDVNDLSLKAQTAGLAVDGSGYVYDTTPETDGRNAGYTDSATWTKYLTKDHYTLEIKYLRKTTLTNVAGSDRSIVSIKYGTSTGTTLLSEISTLNVDKVVTGFDVNEPRDYSIIFLIYDGLADFKIYKNVTSEDLIVLPINHTLRAKWKKAKFEYKGDYVFNGSNYINTDLYLFDEENIGKNFYISFDIKENNSTASNATVMSSASGSNRGIWFRRNGTNNGYQMHSEVKSGDYKNFDYVTYLTNNVRILRINGVMYYSLNYSDFMTINNYNSFSEYFNIPVSFGAQLNNSLNPQNFFVGTLSNMVVEYLDNDASLSDYPVRRCTESFVQNSYWRCDGVQDFVGTNYFNTGIYLFNSANVNRNFHISFEIISNQSTVSQATLINSKNEGNNNYPGFLFRRDNNTYQISINVNSSNKKNVNNISYYAKKVEFLRINKVIYYRIDDNPFVNVLDFTNFTLTFEVPVTIGASLNGSKQPFRYIHGVLSNMLVEFISDNATISDYE